MLEVNLICVGKLKEAYWRAAVAEYEKRLRPFCKFQIVELPEAYLPSSPSQGEIARALEQEGKAILEKTVGKAFPLCIEGKETDSPGLAKKIFDCMRYPGAASFIIGSSHGLSEEVKQAGERLSMSPMTFPHQLARVMLCEQIYRAFQILNGTRYHK